MPGEAGLECVLQISENSANLLPLAPHSTHVFSIICFKNPPLRSCTPPVRSYNGTVRSYNGIVRLYNVIVRLYNGTARLYNGIVRLYNGIVRSYNGIVRLYNGTARSYNGIVQKLRSGSGRIWRGDYRLSPNTSSKVKIPWRPAIHSAASTAPAANAPLPRASCLRVSTSLAEVKVVTWVPGTSPWR